MLTLMIPLFLGLLVNVMIVNTSDLIAIGPGEGIKIVAIVLLSMMYLSIFVWLGMLISTRTERSSTSIVVLLFLWVGMVILIPSCGRIVADSFYEMPSRMEVDRSVADARRQIWENYERYGKNAGNWGGDPHADWVNPPARARLYGAITDSRNRILDHYVHQMVEQVQLGRNFTRVSPTGIYRSACERIAGVGIARFEDLYRQLKRYRETLRVFILDTDRLDRESFHLLIEGRGHRSTLSQKPVDFSAIPKFEEEDLPVEESLRYAIWDLGLLALFNVLLFMGVYVSFLRCEVK
jgi:ABC-type transport system involved in multi-copper enzyme maturation permease subunit